MQAGALQRIAAPDGVAVGVPGLTAAIHHQRIAGSHLDTLYGSNVLQLPTVDGSVHGHVGTVPVPGHVQQHSPGDQALLPVMHRTPLGPVHGDFLIGVAPVPHAVLVPHVAQGVQVGCRRAVIGNAVVVSGEPGCGAAVDLFHVVDGRGRVVGRRNRGELAAERHRAPRPDQASGFDAFLRGDHVDRADLVFVAPAAPVAVVLQVGKHLVLGRDPAFHGEPPWLFF